MLCARSPTLHMNDQLEIKLEYDSHRIYDTLKIGDSTRYILENYDEQNRVYSAHSFTLSGHTYFLFTKTDKLQEHDPS